MLPKYKVKKEYIIDKLHRGFVNVCIVTTVIGSAFIAYKVYEYIRYIRPIHNEMKLKAKEELLAEGKHVKDMAVVMT